MYIHIQIYIYIYMCVCMSYTHLYIYIYYTYYSNIFSEIYIHTHTHTYIYTHSTWLERKQLRREKVPPWLANLLEGRSQVRNPSLGDCDRRGSESITGNHGFNMEETPKFPNIMTTNPVNLPFNQCWESYYFSQCHCCILLSLPSSSK